MKKLIFCIVSFLFFSAGLVLAQVDPSQTTIVIPGGADNPGSIENTINGDTVTSPNGALRANPNRIYVLQANTIYYAEAPILFGNSADTNATLNIIGETTGNLPIILTNPTGGANMFTDNITGNFTIKNVYWPDRSLTNNSADLFGIHSRGRRLIMENVVTEFGGNNLFTFADGGAELYIKNCYFRDMNWFQNSWNSCVVTNGGADTVWVENTTITNTGLGFFLLNTVNFMYFNHNTMVNATKYGITKVQYKEAYFTNNIFVNMNWEGECESTIYTQNDTHTPLGTACIDSSDAPDEALLWLAEQGAVPAQKDVKYLNSNNIHFTDTCLNQYYSGALNHNPGYAYPISARPWAPASIIGDSGTTALPLRVQNIPPIFISDFTVSLAKAYPKIKIDSATIYYSDPQLVTDGIDAKGSITKQQKLEEMAKFSEANYGVAPNGQTYDPSIFAFGDFDPTTVPGVKNEDGGGFTKISDFTENFDYKANIISNIDSKKLGALTWTADGMNGWDSQTEFQDVMTYYNKVTGVEKTDNKLPSTFNLAQNYPNPFNPSTTINFSIPKVSNVKIVIYNILGKEVATLANGEMKAGNYNVTWNAANIASGVYFYTISTPNFTSTKKMVLLK
ncbi:MAG: T9SS type A sorting domain-containing protein [Ignavibacteriaceae bacterium]|nr:T9SS type A sorting domain-containing protein [Ignavibacteriaceae bacterium]